MNLRLLAGVVSLTGVLMLVLLWSSSQPKPRPRSTEASSAVATPSGVPAVIGKVGDSLPPTGPFAKTPVSGAPGYFVVQRPDGSGFLEGPDGKQQPLRSPVTDSPNLEKRVADKIADAPQVKRDVKPENLFFLEKGVVAVPTGGIVTFADKDHVVVLEDGSTVVYYTDGRREVRERRSKSLP